MSELETIMKRIEEKSGCEVVRFRAIEEEFPDTSLGKPKPGMNYAQMLTPGYVLDVTLRCKDGKEFSREYRSNRSGSILFSA